MVVVNLPDTIIIQWEAKKLFLGPLPKFGPTRESEMVVNGQKKYTFPPKWVKLLCRRWVVGWGSTPLGYLV